MLVLKNAEYEPVWLSKVENSLFSLLFFHRFFHRFVGRTEEPLVPSLAGRSLQVLKEQVRNHSSFKKAFLSFTGMGHPLLKVSRVPLVLSGRSRLILHDH